MPRHKKHSNLDLIYKNASLATQKHTVDFDWVSSFLILQKLIK